MGRPLLTIAILAVVAIIGTFLFVPYFPQDPGYHVFAGPRAWLVLSNLPFLIIGVLSLLTVRRTAADIAFGVGLVLTAFGSGIYHWAPSNATLLYDRAGMVVAIMALVGMLAESAAVLAIAEAVGIASLVWWQLNGDLRLYGVVQFFPGLLIVALRRWKLALVLVFYAIAKVCELYDRQIYDALAHVVSGHVLKHLAAAASTYVIWMWSSPPVSGVMSSPARDTTT